MPPAAAGSPEAPGAAPGLTAPPTIGGPENGSGGRGVTDIAREYLGVPYRWGGDDPSTGLDCSGFTCLVMGRIGVSMSRTSAQQATAGTAVSDPSNARPGDLPFFD